MTARQRLRLGLAAALLATVALLPFTDARADDRAAGTVEGVVTDAETGGPLIGATVRIPALGSYASSDLDGRFRLLEVPAGTHTLRVSFTGYETAEAEVTVRDGQTATVAVGLRVQALQEIVEYEQAPPRTRRALPPGIAPPPAAPAPPAAVYDMAGPATGALRTFPSGDELRPPLPVDREGYAPIDEVGFRTATEAPLSTFSIDVDRASYANARRFLTHGSLPPVDAVRVEEFVNAFDYGLDGPGDRGRHPFAVHTEMTEAPWAPQHRLVRIGVQGRRIETEDLPPANLVFLLDVSGSMSAPNKLPLLQRAFRLLVREMRPEDRVAIVVYAGASGLVLEPTPGTEKAAILEALDRLQAGGSTAGAAGLRLAYATARRHFDPEATNRVILATDGDFNVGVSSDAEMQRLIEEERESGVFLSVLGFGTGNLQDSKMELLANKGNGNYAYIDSIREAERVFVREFGGTLVAIAKDVKIQVEFNPAHVAGYRLIGYENRALAAEDFNDDRKDAGELGAGHTVTALYEVVPVGVEVPTAGVDGLRYQTTPSLTPAARSGEWMTVKLRYKPATSAGTFAEASVRLDVPVRGEGFRTLGSASEATRWAVAVTEAALLLRQTDFAPGASWGHALDLARGARGADPHGDRAEFIRLVETARSLAETEGGARDRPTALGD